MEIFIRRLPEKYLQQTEMNSFNSFEKPEVVKPADFNGFILKDGILTVNMPSKSVVVVGTFEVI